MVSKRTQIWQELARYGLDTTSLDMVEAVVTGAVPLPPGVSLDLLKFYLAGRSRAELEWRRVGTGMIAITYESPVSFVGYEWFSFKVPGGSYTPDFNYLLEDGRWIHVEIKGSRAQRNYRDARTHLRAAAALNPWFTFIEARYERGKWCLEHIGPDLSVLAGMRLMGEPLEPLEPLEPSKTGETDGERTESDV